jgi:hypothetical protein
MAFPTNPTDGQQATVNGVIYIYSNTIPAWTVTTNAGANVSANNISAVLAITGATVSASGNVTGANIRTGGAISTTGNIITGTNGYIGIGIATPDTELTILGNPQTVSYPVTGNSTTAGTELHITGADGANTRITQDALGTGSYVAFTGRSARGTAATPTQTQSADILAQFTARGFSNGTLQFGNASTGALSITAAENFTDTSRATNVQILTTAVSSITPTAIATFSSANGLIVSGASQGIGNATLGTGGRFIRNTAGGVSSPSARFALTTANILDVHINTSVAGNSASNTQQYGMSFTNSGGATQAAIVCSENGADGTSIGIFCTNSYATGPQLRAFWDPAGNLLPGANATYDLGSTSARWKTIYTTDLELNNGIGDYTVVEGADDLFLYNNRSGKVFKFALIEVDPTTAPPKAKR